MRWLASDGVIRSLLFVPGSVPAKIRKAASLPADSLILDLEDSVAESEKASAREEVRKAVSENSFPSQILFVRINGYRTAHWRDDVAAVTHKNLRGIKVPKCESSAELIAIGNLLAERERAAGLREGSIKLLVSLESPTSILNAARLAEASPRVMALVFCAEDYALEMGIERTAEGSELFVARSWTALCARAHGCLAIDAIYSDYQDEDGLTRDTEAGRRLGFTGKLAIHPRQIEPIHRAFAPSERELAEARRIAASFEEARSKGQSVASLDGKMIDKPIAERARLLIARANPSKA